MSKVVTSQLRIIVAGMIAQHPQLGGMTWHYLQYLLGLRRLGHDVYYLEATGRSPYLLPDSGVGTRHPNCDRNVAYLTRLMERFGLEDRWAYHCSPTSQWFGLGDRERARVVGSADILLNVSGALQHPQQYRRIPHLCYVDTDPVVTQIKMASRREDYVDRVAIHDSHFSFGESLSATCFAFNHDWRATRQPVVLQQWRPRSLTSDAPSATRFAHGNITTILSWTSYAPVTYSGRTYGQKDVEFVRFLDLPRRVAPAVLEVAMGGADHKKWQANSAQLAGDSRERAPEPHDLGPRELLARSGWRVVDAVATCGDLDSYRRYIESSSAEWSVAKNCYVQGQPGWFSERSACYLAAGRPVVVQDTGFSSALPVGAGVLPFTTLEDAVGAIQELEANYALHAEAARGIAEAFFDSDKVLNRLIDGALSNGGRASRVSRPYNSADQGRSPDAINLGGFDRPRPEGRGDS